MRKTWRKAIALILTFAVTVSGFAGLSSEVQAENSGDVTVTQNGDSVVIGNGYISREFSTADNRLSTVKLVNKRTDEGKTVFTPADGSEEFIVKLTNQQQTYGALDRTNWTATTNSYQNATGSSDGNAANLIDGRISSIWHTNYGGGAGPTTYSETDSDGQAYYVYFDLGEKQSFHAFSYTPRQEGVNTNGNILGYELYKTDSEETLAANAEGWELISSGEFTYEETNTIYVNLDEVQTATQLKFVPISAKNGKTFAAGAEFNLHKDQVIIEENETVKDRDFAASELTLKSVEITDTTAVINEVEKTGKKVTFTFDDYTFEGTSFSITENVVMYDGDHFMRKYMEIEIPDDRKTEMSIDYIELESLKVNETDVTWTIPTGNGGIMGQTEFKSNLGQPIYIQGMFFGCEFPETDTQIADGTGYIRYYTGKTFDRFEKDNQLTTDGKYVTWQTVAGAARSTETQVVQADFFEYIYSIATPSDFRIQYNSWFDNMKYIDDENILESFIEIDREFNRAEVRPIDSYVVDDGWINYNHTSVINASVTGTTLNQSGFWEFNSKFPEGFTPASELVHKFGSKFGVWVGPRGGYGTEGHLADIITASDKGSKAGGSIDVADREYLKNLTEMFVNWQQEYGINYWKWDGFSNTSQYNAFSETDAVPDYENRHMTGGYHNMYHVTDLWEGWIDVFEAVRASEKADGIDKLWISLTCYTNPSPWFLQWANSVWLSCTADQADAGSSTSKMDRQITYRDASYYDYIKNHEFQFPLSNIYNHDPVYGKEGTGMTVNTATDEQFQNYLYMLSTRGTAFWELYFSDSIMTDGKYEVTGEFLEWAEESYHMLKNAKMFGQSPNTGTTLAGSSNGTQNAYGFACFDGKDGIISVRNAATTPQSVTLTFDRTLGVPEDAGTLRYHIEHSYNITEGTPTTGTFTYGEEYTFTLQPDEVRIFRVSEAGDTTAPEFARAYSDGGKVITVKFDEKVTGDLFEVEDAQIESVEKSADDITYRLTLTEAPTDGTQVTIKTADVQDLTGNVCKDEISFIYHKDNLVAKGAAEASGSFCGSSGFTVAATVETAAPGTLVAQGDVYALGINEDGFATFTLNGATAVSDTAVSDGDEIVGVKENNGILKIYVNGTVAGSAYKEENRYYEAEQADITVANVSEVRIADTAYGYDAVSEVLESDSEVPEAENAFIPSEKMTISASSADETEPAYNKDPQNAIDGDETTFWATVPDATLEDAYYIVELDDVYEINRVDYTKRYHSGAGYNCTGNLLNYVIEVSTDGETWTQAAAGTTNDGTTAIVFNPVEAKYVKITATESYHWKDSLANTVMTIAELKIYEVTEESSEPTVPTKIKVACVGDSLTDGYKSTNGNKSNTAYPAYLQKLLGADYEVGNFGKTSMTLMKGTDRSYWNTTEYAESLAFEPDIVIIMLGSNDSKNWDEAAFKEDAIALVNQYKALETQPRVIFATSPQCYVTGGTDITAEGVAAVVEVQRALIAENNWETVDMYEKTEGKEELYDSDLLHFTDNGYYYVAQCMYEAITAETVIDTNEPEDEVVRISGTTRYETGYKVADELKAELGVDQFEAVVVATGKNFADALAGSYLAAAKNAPILLTNGKADNIAALHEYIAANVVAGGTVYLLGGEAAVPTEAAAIDGYDVVRLSGKSRYETNLAILAEAGVAGDEMIVATGKTFADSLSASAAKLPILLVKPGTALSDEAQAIAEGMNKFYIIGGEGAVSADIETELAVYGEVVRVSGKTRYETSVAVANTFFADVEEAVVANGKNFPDGLCGGPLAAAMNAPLILTADGKTEAAADYMEANAIEAGYVLGGTGALADESVVDVFALESAEEIIIK